ncbi:MAG TPA: hypothetical protein VFY43_00910 [Candidatus Limnocylindria bacterium]|nr:hypothetical protein [Candidatus Limnocylindria bacterium]
MNDAAPGRVLRLALVAWGFGDLAMGSRVRGIALLAAELIGLVLVTASATLLAPTTWYLVPFLLGMAFIVAWAVQAVAAFLRAQRRQGAIAPPPGRSPAAAAAWLTVPLLLWGTGFWLFAASSASPGAVLDAFVTEWPDLADEPMDDTIATDPAAVSAQAESALVTLRRACTAAGLTENCQEEASALLVNVRMRIQSQTDDSATAVAELVRFERQPSKFLGVFETTDLVPVPIAPVLRLELAAQPAPLGSVRWIIVNADAAEGVAIT